MVNSKGTSSIDVIFGYLLSEEQTNDIEDTTAILALIRDNFF